MKSEQHISIEKSNFGRLIVACAFGLLGLLLSSAESKAQLPLWIDRQPIFVPRSPSNTRIKPSEPAPRVQPTEAAPVTPGTAVSPTGVEGAPGVPSSPLPAPTKVRNNEISVAADFMIGQGDITVPIGYSLRESVPGSEEFPVQAASADRSSIYYGGTISYSYKRAWFIDLSTARGSSSGNVDFPAFEGSSSDSDFKTKFTIDDEWYQAYVRYTFPALRGKPFSAYLRAGASYVMADLEVTAIGGPPPRYSQEDSTRDILGNVGFGVTYMLYTTRKIRLGISGEGEGFYGIRNQESTERLTETDLDFKTANIDNTLYGGIGRATLRLEYILDRARAWTAYGEVGAQARYTVIDYPDAKGSTPTELLWGPYAKIGMRYNF